MLASAVVTTARIRSVNAVILQVSRSSLNCIVYYNSARSGGNYSGRHLELLLHDAAACERHGQHYAEPQLASALAPERRFSLPRRGQRRLRHRRWTLMASRGPIRRPSAATSIGAGR